jgi:hypothetical protein
MNLLPALTGNAAAVDRKLFWRYKGKWQRAARIGDYKLLKILDNTFLFNVVEDPLERGNLKERHKEHPEFEKHEGDRSIRRDDGVTAGAPCTGLNLCLTILNYHLSSFLCRKGLRHV